MRVFAVPRPSQEHPTNLVGLFVRAGPRTARGDRCQGASPFLINESLVSLPSKNLVKIENITIGKL
jgi:hypothetical protein